LFGRRVAAERVAHGEMDRAAADADAARLSLVAEVVRNWIELRSAQDRESLLLQISEARQRQARLVGTRVSLALASKQQLAQADAAAAEVRAALSAPRQEIIAASQNLAALLGQAEPDRTWLQAGPLPHLDEWRVTSVPADLLRARPDIAQSQADVLRVSGELGLAKADQYPSIGLGGSLRWSTSTTTNRQTRSDEAITALGPVIDIPLFDWGLRHAVASAKADEFRAAVFAYRNTVLAAVAEAETAMGALEQQRQRESASVDAWRSLGEVAGSAAERGRLGLASDIDRLESDVARDQSAVTLAEARSAHDLAYVALCKALGGAPPSPSAAGAH
jgi:outer membrane protein TolC